MINSIEICKQLSSLNFINVKLKLKQIFRLKLLECDIYEKIWRLHVCFSVAIYSGIQCQNCFKCQLGKLKLRIANVSYLFSMWVGLFTNSREIEPTVSYKQFLIKNACTQKSLFIIIRN